MNGHPSSRPVEIDLSDEEVPQFWSHVDQGKPDECWRWNGYRDGQGYGTFSHGGRSVKAHRVSYTLAHGRIEPGMVIDHLCENTSCVNPAHLEAVSNGENVRRAVASGRIPRPKLSKRRYCKRGHEMTDDNTYVFPSTRTRRCRKCLAVAQHQAYLRRKAQKASA